MIDAGTKKKGEFQTTAMKYAGQLTVTAMLNTHLNGLAHLGAFLTLPSHVQEWWNNAILLVSRVVSLPSGGHDP